MNRLKLSTRFVLAGAVAASVAVAPRLFAPKAALAQEPVKAAAPVALMLPSTPPPGAIVLYSGKPGDVAAHWLKRYSQQTAGWTIEGGAFTPNRTDIVSKEQFGDFFLHVEFKVPTGHGNAGIGLQGRYEVQIYNSFGETPGNQNGGAFYNQKPASLNASKKQGEWESYDILFRAPRLDADGKVTEKPRATVFQNGVLIHNNNEFLDMTGIQYEEYKTMGKTGPIILQGDHDQVQYRNIWVVPM